MLDSRNRQRGTLLVAAGAVLFSINAGVSRVVQTAGVDSTTLTSARCTGTAVVLLGVLYATGGRLRLPRSRASWLQVVGFGLFGVALVQWLYFVAIDRLPVGIALLLEYLAPVLVAGYVRVVGREQLRRRIWLGLGLSLLGLALVAEVWSGLALDGIGVLAGLGAAASLAGYFLIGEHSVSDTPPLQVLTEAFVIAAVFWNLVAPVTGLGRVGLGTQAGFGGRLETWHAPVWLLLTWMVLLGTALPFLAELTALRHLTATEATLVGMLEPVGATVLGWAWFEQSLSVAQSFGVVAILLGIVLAQTARQGLRAPELAVPGI